MFELIFLAPIERIAHITSNQYNKSTFGLFSITGQCSFSDG